MSEGVWDRYGAWGLLRLVGDVIYTRLAHPRARIVRRPVYIRGARHIRLGEGFTSGVGLRIDAFPPQAGPGETGPVGPVIRIGANVQVNDYVHIAAISEVSIGSDTLIASKVFISDHNHGDYQGVDPQCAPSVPPADRPLRSRPVRIGANVWVGEHVCIMPGVTIGDGAIIGAGAVVTNDIPENSIAVGAPARILRRFDPVTGGWPRSPFRSKTVNEVAHPHG